MYVLDVPGGGTVIIDLDDFAGDLFDDFVEQASPIVASMRVRDGLSRGPLPPSGDHRPRRTAPNGPTRRPATRRHLVSLAGPSAPAPRRDR